jgi:hypothetical protein
VKPIVQRRNLKDMKSATGTGTKRTNKPKPKPKRPTAKMFVVSDDTHKRLKEYAQKKGYKLQYVADEAISEYLKRQEAK